MLKQNISPARSKHCPKHFTSYVVQALTEKAGTYIRHGLQFRGTFKMAGSFHGPLLDPRQPPLLLQVHEPPRNSGNSLPEHKYILKQF